MCNRYTYVKYTCAEQKNVGHATIEGISDVSGLSAGQSERLGILGCTVNAGEVAAEGLAVCPRRGEVGGPMEVGEDRIVARAVGLLAPPLRPEADRDGLRSLCLTPRPALWQRSHSRAVGSGRFEGHASVAPARVGEGAV